MEVSTENSKIVTVSKNNISADISMNGQKLEEVWLTYVTCHDSLSKTILQDTLEGGRRHGRQRKCWVDNIKEWTSLPMPELLTRLISLLVGALSPVNHRGLHQG